MTWYLTPEALALLTKRPASHSFERRYALTIDHWSEYSGPAVAKLHALYTAEFDRLNNQRPGSREALDAHLSACPGDVLGAVFGDPDTGGAYRSFRDGSAKWAAIRNAVSNALAMKAAA